MITWSVLFANDDVLTQWEMTEAMVGAGFNVVGACRAKQVSDALCGNPDFDVLLLDLDLPEMASSYELGHAWRRALPGKPIIYTGTSRHSLMQPLLAHETFLKTPFDAGSLLQAIDVALEDASFKPMIPTQSRQIHHVH